MQNDSMALRCPRAIERSCSSKLGGVVAHVWLRGLWCFAILGCFESCCGLWWWLEIICQGMYAFLALPDKLSRASKGEMLH
jgi:hypothetical protein